MIENFKDRPEVFKDYDSKLLLKIINKTTFDTKKSDDKELFVDEKWRSYSIKKIRLWRKIQKNTIRNEIERLKKSNSYL